MYTSISSSQNGILNRKVCFSFYILHFCCSCSRIFIVLQWLPRTWPETSAPLRWQMEISHILDPRKFIYIYLFFSVFRVFIEYRALICFFFYFLVYSVNLLVSVSSEWPIYLKLYTQRWSFAQNCGLYALLCGLSFRNGKF